MYRFARVLPLLLAMDALPAFAADDPADTDFEPTHFYSLRPDPRACPSPTCGGYWLKRLNRATTRCADGTEQAECYVAGLRRVPAAGLGSGEQVLVQGRLREHDYAGIGSYGVFVIRAAWLAAGAEPATGRYVAIENNGIACISSPCFSYDQFVLNRGIVRHVSGLDFDSVPKYADGSLPYPGEGEAIVAAGYNEQRREFEGIGLWFVASQVFTRIP
jgi:hypothetical protein